MSGNRTPPPSYSEAMRQDLRRKSSYGTADWTSQSQAGEQSTQFRNHTAALPWLLQPDLPEV